MRQVILKHVVSGFGSVCFNYEDDSEVIRVADLKWMILQKFGIGPAEIRLTTEGGRCVNDEDELFEDAKDAPPRVFSMLARLCGGKGGFGSMLRAQGGRMSSQKTTNFEACRDLSGHRMRTLNLVKRISDKLKNDEKKKSELEEKFNNKIKKCLRPRTNKKIRIDDSKFLEDRKQAAECTIETIEMSKRVRRKVEKSGKSATRKTGKRVDVLISENGDDDILLD